MSLSDFVNRRVGNDSRSYQGAIQEAIEQAGTNGNQTTGIRDNTSETIPNYHLHTYLFPFADDDADTNNTNNYLGSRNNATGIPLEVNQANILLPLAPRLSARSDTFKIRAYGEVRDADDKIIAQATCEAVVQRLPEYVDPDTDSITTIHGMMIPRPLHSTPSTRPTAAVLKFRASDGWIKAKYNFTFMSLLRPTLLLACLSVLISGSLTCAQEPAREQRQRRS